MVFKAGMKAGRPEIQNDGLGLLTKFVPHLLLSANSEPVSPNFLSLQPPAMTRVVANLFL